MILPPLVFPALAYLSEVQVTKQKSVIPLTIDFDQPRQDKPVYYLPEEPDSLHGDRSPFNFEPADMVLEDPENVYPEHYVIKEHTYEMCPGANVIKLFLSVIYGFS